MNTVEPIRDVGKIKQMKETLGFYKDNATDKQILEAKRNRMLFVFGINVGLRISDIVKLTLSDILEENGNPKTHLNIIEKKTKKAKRIRINKQLADELTEYIEALLYIQYRIEMKSISARGTEQEKYLSIANSTYIFYSNKGDHLTRIQAYRILADSAEKCNIKYFGSHSLRKTFGYFHYMQYKDVALLQTLFNHSAPSVTLRYIRYNSRLNGRFNGQFPFIKIAPVFLLFGYGGL